MRFALTIEYEGSNFCGFQTQRGVPTIQDALQAALSQVAGESIAVFSAGRTDAGVHAVAQVVHFDTAIERPLSAWIRGVNSHLPEGIAVLAATLVPQDFHARFSALSRRYRYVLLNRPQRPGLMNKRVGWYHHPLDAAKMQEALPSIMGTHDFSAFRAASCQARSPVRELQAARVFRHQDLIIFEFKANAFLHHMVRNLVGSLVYIGQKKHPPEWMAYLLQQKNRQSSAPTFSPAGLYFMGADYDPRWGIATDHPEPMIEMNVL